MCLLPGSASLILWLVLASLVQIHSAGIELPFCQNQKIYILDLNTLAGGEVQACELNKVAVVNPSNGVVYHPQAKLKERVSHQYGTHSSTWYLAEALKKSGLVTSDIEAADIVFVDSYCHYTWWLGWTHTRGRENTENPGNSLIAAYQKIAKSSRFLKNGGIDYVFTDPHPAFAQGAPAKPYWTLMCQTFKDAMHILSEKGQRNVCRNYWQMERKLLAIPYVPNFGTEGQYTSWQVPLKPFAARSTFLYSSTRCTPYRIDKSGTVINAGKKMRRDIAKALGNTSSDVVVKCKDPESSGGSESFGESLKAMQSSKFCLVLPGDSASTRQLGEIMMAGCIPVFLGPPYHTMTFHQEVDYKAIGLFYNVSQYHSWQTETMHWEIHSIERPANPQIPWFWVLEKEVYPQLNHIQTVSDIVQELRNLPQSKVDSITQMMDSQRQLFVYYDYLTTRWTAVNAIISRICLMAGNTRKAKGTQPVATATPKATTATGSRAMSKVQLDHQARMDELSSLFGKQFN